MYSHSKPSRPLVHGTHLSSRIIEMKKCSTAYRNIECYTEQQGIKLNNKGTEDPLTPKAPSIKGKIDKLDLIKIKDFCSLKLPLKRMKRQATDWENIFANHVPNKGLVFRIYKELSELDSTKKKNLTRKWTKYMNIHFTKEDTEMANQHMKRCSTSLATEEMQIKTVTRYH